MLKLSVIIPCYNEETTIEEIIRQVQATGRAEEIIVVDDGSTDGSREILSRLDGLDGVKVVLHDQNLGKGAGVRTGIQHATGQVLLVQDADLVAYVLNVGQKMGAQNHGLAATGQGHDQVLDLAAPDGVEAGRRFIEQDE